LSPKYPIVSSTKIVSALKRGGFIEVSQKGSHLKLTNAGRVVIVPMHNEVARGTLKGVLEQAGMDIKDFLNLL